MVTKVCSKCHEKFDSEKHKTCESCRKYKREWNQRNAERCSKWCKNWREANPERVRETQRKWCDAHSEYHHEWHKKNYDRIKPHKQEYMVEWRASNKERMRDTSHVWYQLNREHALEQNRNWALEHPEYRTNWGRNNPERVGMYNHKRRTMINGTNGSYTIEERNALFEKQKGTCFYCGEMLYGSFDNPIHVDHKIPLSRGGMNDISNIVLAHARCNLSKGTKTPEEYLGAIRLWNERSRKN